MFIFYRHVIILSTWYKTDSLLMKKQRYNVGFYIFEIYKGNTNHSLNKGTTSGEWLIYGTKHHKEKHQRNTTGTPFVNMDLLLYTQHGHVITSIAMYGMKLLIHFQTSTVQPLKFGNG